jgi:tRNA-binding protein
MGDSVPSADIGQFLALDMRVGTVVSAIVFEKARKPAYQLQIDFGKLGIKKSSAQITDLYTPETLVGKQVIAVVNFPPRQIANFISEVLVLGSVNEEGKVTLLQPERLVPNGEKIA